MRAPFGEGLIEGLARNWWLFVLRGGAAVLFGILALVWPDVTVSVLVFLFAVYAMRTVSARYWRRGATGAIPCIVGTTSARDCWRSSSESSRSPGLG